MGARCTARRCNWRCRANGGRGAWDDRGGAARHRARKANWAASAGGIRSQSPRCAGRPSHGERPTTAPGPEALGHGRDALSPLRPRRGRAAGPLAALGRRRGPLVGVLWWQWGWFRDYWATATELATPWPLVFLAVLLIYLALVLAPSLALLMVYRGFPAARRRSSRTASMATVPPPRCGGCARRWSRP